MFFQLSPGILSSERNFFEFEGGQYTNLILGLFEIFNFENFLLTMEMESKDLSCFNEDI